MLARRFPVGFDARDFFIIRILDEDISTMIVRLSDQRRISLPREAVSRVSLVNILLDQTFLAASCPGAFLRRFLQPSTPSLLLCLCFAFYSFYVFFCPGRWNIEEVGLPPDNQLRGIVGGIVGRSSRFIKGRKKVMGGGGHVVRNEDRKGSVFL